MQIRVAGEILAALFLSKEKLPPRLELTVHFPGSNLTHEQSNLEEPWVQNEQTELKHKAIVTKDSGFKIEEVKPLKHFILLNVLQAEKKMLAMFSNGCCGKFFFRAGGGKPKCALHLEFVGEISQLNHNVLLVALPAVACWSCGCKLHS